MSALVPAAIAVAVAANLSVWGSILYRVRHPLPEPKRAPYKPRHVATERIHAGGRYLAVQPRRDSAPLTEQAIITSRPGRPWDTAANPVLNDDAETLRLGGWGTMPAERVIAAELPQVIAL